MKPPLWYDGVTFWVEEVSKRYMETEEIGRWSVTKVLGTQAWSSESDPQYPWIGVMAHAYNLSPGELEAGGYLRLPGQSD